MGLTQLSWLNFYHTLVCLLLGWQYYRLARAMRLSERASFIFVLLNVLTFGNDIFSFYRYYGLSSSIFAQLAAIALPRIALESFRRADTIATYSPKTELQIHSPLAGRHFLLRLMGAAALLLALIALNHPQGLGIAGLGTLAVIVWRLVEGKRAMILWLGGAAVAMSVAAVVWFPGHRALYENHVTQEWLAPWYGFNFFVSTSPTFDRSLQILGIFGILNLPLAFWFIASKNHVAGWLTLFPIIALALPCFALPVAHLLASRPDTEGLVAFHRLLFAVPSGLMIAVLASELTTSSNAPSSLRGAVDRVIKQHACGCLLPVLIVGAMLPSASRRDGIRLWHSSMKEPADSRLEPIWTLAAEYDRFGKMSRATHLLVTCIPGSVAIMSNTKKPVVTGRYNRNFANPAVDMVALSTLIDRHNFMAVSDAMVVNPRTFFTPFSQAGFISGHWSTQEPALASAGGAELADQALARNHHHHTTRNGTFYQAAP